MEREAPESRDPQAQHIGEQGFNRRLDTGARHWPVQRARYGSISGRLWLKSLRRLAPKASLASCHAACCAIHGLRGKLVIREKLLVKSGKERTGHGFNTNLQVTVGREKAPGGARGVPSFTAALWSQRGASDAVNTHRADCSP
jgi:hypothetical protein